MGVPLENRLTQQQPIIISLIDNSLAIFSFPRGNRALYPRAMAAHTQINDDDLSSWQFSLVPMCVCVCACVCTCVWEWKSSSTSPVSSSPASSIPLGRTRARRIVATGPQERERERGVSVLRNSWMNLKVWDGLFDWENRANRFEDDALKGWTTMGPLIVLKIGAQKSRAKPNNRRKRRRKTLLDRSIGIER